ncbi:MAG: DUF748 domain-containing protein [Rhodospirillaceae bacterium]|nr:DUF748 domain-containing protein [Rhodospirillales bacterium]
MTTAGPFWTLRRKLWAMAAATAMMAFAAAGYWLPDMGLRYGLIRSLRELGWARVSVSDADLSLFNGAIVVRRVEAGEALGKMLGIDGIDLKFRWKPLFSRRVSVEHLDLQGVAIDIHRDGADYVVNGLPILMGASAGGSDWSYDITALTLAGSRIDFTDGAFAAAIQVDKLKIAELKSWEPGTPVRYHLRGRVNGTPITLEGTATPFASAPHFALKLTLDALDLASVAELARRAGASPVIGKVTADISLEGSRDAIHGAGTLALKDTAWTSGTTKLSAAALALDLSQLAWDKDRLTVAGTAAAKALAVDDGGVALRAESLTLEARSAAFDAKTSVLSWDGKLHAERHSLAVDDTHLDHGKLDWTGATRLNLAANAQSFVHAEGKAETSDVRLGLGSMTVDAARVTAEGVFEHARPDGKLPPLAGRIQAVAEQVWVREPDRNWLNADRVELHDLHLVPGSTATLARLEARNLKALAKRGKKDFYPWRLEARQTQAERITMNADGAVAASSLTVTGAVGRITRTKSGLYGLPQGGDEGEASTSAPALALGKLRLGGDSRLEFEDRSLSEPVRLRLDGLELSITDLDSAKPDRDSPFTAKARIGGSRISANGRARLFAASPGGEMKAELRALELPPLSPYAADTLGVHLQTGHLDAEISMGVNQGKLDGAMQLTLSELFVAQPDPNAPLAKRADMPVETVLDLLRDSDNRIKLSIPVRGDLSNPDFDVSDGVNQAIGAALKSTVFTTLKVAFPLAGLISLVIDESESRRLALDPLKFVPGAEALGEPERKQLTDAAKLMDEHPALKLTLCGTAQPNDWAGLVERKRIEESGLLGKLQKMVGNALKVEPPPLDMARLSDLADARAQAAKTFLVDQASIDPGRLFTCRPRVETDGKSLPRVDLVL